MYSRISFLICSQSEVNAQCSCSMEEGRKFYQGEREDPEVLLTPAGCKVLSEAPTGVALVGTMGLLSSAAQGAKKITSCKSRMSHKKPAVIPSSLSQCTETSLAAVRPSGHGGLLAKSAAESLGPSL